MREKMTRIGIMVIGLVLALSSCDGVLDGIYDKTDNSAESKYGFLTKSDGTSVGTVYVDATKYNQWVYVNFHECTIDSALIDTSKDAKEPANWDIAIHRYDVKTNGGSGLETNFTTIQDLQSSGKMPSGVLKPDSFTTNKVIIDMSGMMDGHLVYASTYYNATISKWLNVDTSVMPPIYTASGKVYIVKFSDGTFAALHLDSYMDDSGVKGYMKFSYVYPLTLK